MSCLDAEQIEMHALQRLPAALALTVEAHLATCSACRQLLREWQENAEFGNDLNRLLPVQNTADFSARDRSDMKHGAKTSAAPRDDNSMLHRKTHKAAQISNLKSGLGSPVQWQDSQTSDGTSSGNWIPVSPGNFQAAAEAEVNGLQIPGYEIVRELARAGQGIVYEAVQVSTKAVVAVKVLREGPLASERNKWRFEREVHLVAALRHPNIVAIHDSGITSGRYFYAMDYVRGQPLDTHVRITKPTARQIAQLMNLVCEAVAHAHRKGVIHRDLKPSNVLVNEKGTPFVLDFGMAKVVGDELNLSLHGFESMPGNLMGTIRYMAPEQTLGQPEVIDTRTDVYALGVILYELLTGEPPYLTNVELTAALKNIRETDPPKPSKRQRSISADLDTIVLKAMDKNPDRRYQSAGELGQDLQAWLEGRPISARSASTLYVIRKLASKHYFEALVIFALISAVFGFGGFALHANWSRQNAVLQKEQSDRATVTTNNEFKLLRDRNALLARSQSMGWFLLEWREGRLGRAAQIRNSLPAESPESIAMAFLLDEKASLDQLLASMPAGEHPLAYFVAGERALRSGASQQAIKYFGQCLGAPGNDSMKQAAQARLKQLRAEQR